MSPVDQSMLQGLLCDIFLIDPSEFSFDLTREEIDTWDSLALVSVGLGIEERFGRKLSNDELSDVRSLGDLRTLLEVSQR
jgi:acyl carrier protein